eukprot:m.360331 g.360331  ORF g.360331 m.360331 type:complete len:320 (+) comp18986_c0_seq1:240-1199(+)
MARTCLGLPISPPEGKQRWLLIGLVVEILLVVGLTVWAMVDIRNTINKQPFDQHKLHQELVFAGMLIFNAACVLFFVIHGVYFERKWELIFFMLASVLTTAYVIYSFVEKDDDLSQGERIARLAVGSVSLPINVIGGIWILNDLGWNAFHVVGARPDLQRIYNNITRLQAWLYLDFELAVSLFILALAENSLSTTEKVVTSVGLTLSVAWIFLGPSACRRESKPLLAVFLFLALFEPAFLIYKIIDMTNEGESSNFVFIPFAILSGISFMVRTGVVVFSILGWTMFGKGFKEQLQQYKRTLGDVDNTATEKTPIVPGRR